MYREYWGFSENPFENTPDPRFIYYSNQHLEAMARLMYSISEKKGAAILTGEYGSGKTVISRIVANKLLQQEDKFNMALVVNPPISPLEMLMEILYQLGDDVEKGTNKVEMLRILNDRLYKNVSENRHTVIIIDEAQAIDSNQVFEEIRLLLNFQSNDGFLLTLLLLGQPELREKVGAIPQLDQRLSVRYHLRDLSFEDTAQYIRHRCQMAGRKENVFSDIACKLIYEAAGGIPRKINNICDISLLTGFSRKNVIVDEDIVRVVTEDLREYSRHAPEPVSRTGVRGGT